ncbi:MAG TPA: hypothetical protein ENN14_01515 [Chloroflexi bacterium]|nr:hypothetical protein [Chloroflexota bacterium]
MSWTEALLQVQEADLEIQRADTRLKEIARLLQDQSELLAARKAHERAEAAAQAQRKTQKDTEFELQRVETEREQKQAQLYGGKIKNPRELKDLEAKVASLKKRKAQLEDRLLETMLAREEAEEIAAAALQAYQEAEARWEANTSALRTEQETLEARKVALREQIAKQEGNIPASVLDSYRYLRKRLGGTVVARLRDDVCGVCGIEVRVPTRRKAIYEEEAYCDGCGRLLVK